MADNSWFEGDKSPGAGEIGQMHTLHTHLADTAEAARTARTDLVGMQDHVTDTVWRGPAATEFKKDIDDKFLGQLAKLDASYQEAADGFATYISAVSDLKTRSHTLARQIYTAETVYDAAAAGLHLWAGSYPGYAAGTSGSASAPPYGHGAPLHIGFTTPAGPACPTPEQLAAASTAAAQARSAHDSAQTAVENAWTHLQQLYQQMHDMQTNDRVAADNAVIAKLTEAHEAGLRNESGWHHFFRMLATVAKWVAIALLVIAVIAVICMIPVLGGFMAALAAITTAGGAAIGGLSVASLVIYGGALASAAALVGDVGQRYSEGDEKPGWKQIGLDAVGIVPGIGAGGRLVSRFGAPAARAVTAVSDGILAVKQAASFNLGLLGAGASASRLGTKFPWLGSKAVQGATKGAEFVENYGIVKPVDTKFGAALWSLTKINGLWGGAGKIFPDISKGAVFERGQSLLDSRPSDGSAATAQRHIAQVQASNPGQAARARAIADSLAHGRFTTVFPPGPVYGPYVPAAAH